MAASEIERRKVIVARAEIYAAVCGQLQSRIASRRYACEQRDADPVTGPGIGIGYRLLTELDDALGAASTLLEEVRAIVAKEAGDG